MSFSIAWRLAIAVATGPATCGAHLRVERLGRVLGDDLLRGGVERLARVLDEQAARGQRRDPHVVAADAAEETAGEAIVHGVALADALLHRVDRLVVAQRHEQRILALVDLGAQPIADRLEVILRDVEPLVLLEEILHVADVVGRQRHDVAGQCAQLLGHHLGVALVGGLVGRANADQQQGHVADALRSVGKGHHTRVLAREKLREGSP